MKKLNVGIFPFFILVIALIFFASCDQNTNETIAESDQVEVASLEKQIEMRLRTYEQHLREGDSIALGKMYTMDAEIIPHTAGRANITKVFGSMIRDSITGSNFTTTKLWGTNDMVVEDGIGTWSHANGTVVGSGRYLLVWIKDDGTWKIVRDTWFPDKEK